MDGGTSKLKLFGELGLGLTRLDDDVKKAKLLLEGLAKDAEKLGTAFNKIDHKGAFSDIAAGIKTLASQYEQLSKQADKAAKSQENATKQKSTTNKSTSNSSSNGNNVVDTQKEYDKKRKADLDYVNWWNKQLDNQDKEEAKKIKQKQQNDNQLEKEKKEQLTRRLAFEKQLNQQELQASKELFELVRNKYNVGDLSKYNYARTLQTGLDHDRYSGNDIYRVRAELQRVNREIENDRSRMYVDNLRHAQRTGQVNLNEYRQHLQNLLNMDRLSERDRRRVLEDLHTTQIRLERDTTRQLQAEQRRRAQEASQFNRTQQRFGSLMDYAFDATIIYGSIQGVKEVVNAVKDIEAESIALQRVSHFTNTEMKEMRDNAFDVGRATGLAATEVQKIQNLWVRAGDYTKEAVQELTKVTAVGVNTAGFENAEDAVIRLNAALNQMQIGWQDAGKVLDSWVKVADQTAIKSTRDLADSLMVIGSQAKLFGMSYHEVNAVTGILAERMAKSGKEIGTAMKTVFSYFQDERAIKVLDKYGVQVKKNAKEYNDFVLIMSQLHKVYQQLEADSNQQAIHEIDEALGRIRRVDVVGNLIDGWDRFGEIVQISLNSTGYAMDQNQVIMSSWEKQIGQLQVAFQQLAWSIGEAGLLKDLKDMVQAMTRGIDWFVGLNTSTVAFTVRLLELIAVMGVLQKTTALLFGTGLTKFIAQTIGQIGILIGSQRMLNFAQRAGVVFTQQQTGATLMNNTVSAIETRTILANTGARNLSTSASGRLVIATNTESAAHARNTLAVRAETGATIALNEARMVGAGTGLTGMLGATATALLNPITLLLVAIPLVIAGVTAWNAHEKQLAEDTEAFIEKRKELNKIIQDGVVSEMQVGDVELRIGKLNELIDKYDDLKDKQEEAFDRNDLDGMDQYALYQREIDELEVKFKDLGTTVETAKDDLEGLKQVSLTSTDANQRVAKQVINQISVFDKQNIKVKEMVDSLDSLDKKSQEYRDTVRALVALFPEAAEGLDQATNTVKINKEAILQAIASNDGLTESQKAQIATTFQLTEEHKRAAKVQMMDSEARAKKLIADSQAIIRQLIAELNIHKALAANNWMAIGDSNPILNSPNRLTEQEAKSILGTPGIIDELKQKGAISMVMNNDANVVYDALKRDGKLDMLSNPAIKAVAKDLNKGQAIIDEINKTLKTIETVPLYEPYTGDTPLAGDPEKEKKPTAEKKEAEPAEKFFNLIKDRKSLLDQITDDIDTLSVKIDMLGDSDGNRLQKGLLWNQVMQKQIEKQDELHSLNEYFRGSLSDLNKQIDQYVKGWSSMTPEQRVKALNNLTDDQKSKLGNLISSYEQLTVEIRKNSSEWWKTQKEIEETKDNQLKLLSATIKQTYELEKQAQSQALIISFQKEELELQNKILGTTLEKWQLESDAIIKAKEEQLSLLDKETEKEEYLKSLKDVNDQIDDAKNDTQYSYINPETMKEEFTYDHGKVNDLEDQKSDLIDDHNQKEAKDALQQELDDLRQQSQDKKKEYDDALNDLKKDQEDKQKAFDLYWEKILSDEAVNEKALELLQAKGYETAQKNLDTHLKTMKTKISSYEQPMFFAGQQLGANLSNGFDLIMNDWITDTYNKFQRLVTNLQQMVASAPSGSSSSSSSSGTVKKYHSGGFVQGVSIGNHEVVAKLLEGEYVLSHQTLDRLAITLPKLLMSMPSISKIESPSTQTIRPITIHISSIKADNFEEMMLSLKPYIMSHS